MGLRKCFHLTIIIQGPQQSLIWTQIYPIDSAKTQYQRNCLTKAKGQPVKMPRIQFFNLTMYRGLGVSMARSCLLNALYFSCFESTKKYINKLPDPVAYEGDPID